MFCYERKCVYLLFICCFRQRAKPGPDWWDVNMEELDTEEYIKRIKALNRIKDSYEFSTSSSARIHPNLLLWNFLRDEEFSREAETFVRIMETEQSWDKLRYSKILIQNQIINFKSASELLNLMATKNFTISHFLKVNFPSMCFVFICFLLFVVNVDTKFNALSCSLRFV